MIEVSIWLSGMNGDGCMKYLIDVPTDRIKPQDYFSAAPVVDAIRRALTQFVIDHSQNRITRIDIRDTPDKVLQL